MFGALAAYMHDVTHQVESLIEEMNAAFREGASAGEVRARLTAWSGALFDFLPLFIQRQLLLQREVSGNLRLSQIATEQLLASLVGLELDRRKKANTFKGKFAPVCSYGGYEARCATPSVFDCECVGAMRSSSPCPALPCPALPCAPSSSALH